MMYHRGRRLQSGRGLGSIFGGLMRGLLPVAKTAINTVGRMARTNTGKVVGRALKDAALKGTLDILEGRKVGETAKQHLKQATKDIVTQAAAINERKRRKGSKPRMNKKPRRQARKPPRSTSPMF